MGLNVFGPVPSRRLGKSIGINNIPPKTCSYACIYCQVGKTTHWLKERHNFFEPDLLIDETRQKIAQLNNPQQEVDYLTIVSDGEPTLDAQLGPLIRGLQSLRFPVAVITNSSLLSDESVRADLNLADYVSVKFDAASDHVWKKINRPMRGQSLDAILNGLQQFARFYHGRFVTETMLLKDINDHKNEIDDIATTLTTIKPKIAYIAVPTRPPAVKTVKPATEETVTRAYHVFSSKGLVAELLVGYEGNAFAASGDARNDILSITAVHPMRWDALENLLKKNRASWHVVNELVQEDRLTKIQYGDFTYYARQLKRVE